MEVIEIAMGWVRTPWAEQGRQKGQGADCAGLIIGVGKELGAVDPAWDFTQYSQAGSMGELLGWLGRLADPVAIEDRRQGDIVVVSMPMGSGHAGIIYDHPDGGLGIIHALKRNEQVSAHQMRDSMAARIVAQYRYRGMNG